MKKICIVFLNLILAVSISGCFGVYFCTEGSGHLSKQLFDVPKFKSITINVPSKIFIVQDTITKVEVETDDNLLNFLDIKVADNRLVIDSEKGICPRRLDIRITNPIFKEIQVNGSADVIAQTPISLDKMYIGINGSGDILIDSIQTRKITIEINGSGDIQLGGVADEFNSEINGSGDVKAIKLIAKKAKIETNGSGDVYVNCTEDLEVQISGSGDVYYLGEPNRMHFEFSGSGRAKKYTPKENSNK